MFSILFRQKFNNGCGGYFLRVASQYHKNRIDQPPRVEPEALQPSTAKDLDFLEYKLAFQAKGTGDIIRALVVLRLCGFQILVNNAEKLLGLSRSILGRRFSNFLIKKTIYNQFVGGENVENLRKCERDLSQAGIGLLLAMPIEEDHGEKSSEGRYEDNLQAMLESVKLAAQFGGKYPMMQLKITALMPGELVTKITEIIGRNNDNVPLDMVAEMMARGKPQNLAPMSEAENDKFFRGMKRLNDVCQHAKEMNVTIMVDAEYTYMNPAIRLVTLAMMLNYNAKSPKIWHTYQCYLKAADTEIMNDMQLIESRGCCFGAKIVRGAYMTKERRLAREKGYPDPVNDSHADTNAKYDYVVSMLLNRCEQVNRPLKFIIATHNENSIRTTLRRMKELDIPPDNDQVFFGQLLGMCDQISYPLGKAGYNVFKSIPYGNIDDTIPYLIRRAQENQSVFKGIRKEKQVLWSVLKTRITRTY
ncbi:hydroxyproline dehydrogenase-like [Tubulanus polymorphus]|uniref:hydroxyproline dehydrogenase-like n=1 Tax=Tubulanus polymorphus TaxID=672921 RepID=UPI003DA62DE6